MASLGKKPTGSTPVEGYEGRQCGIGNESRPRVELEVRIDGACLSAVKTRHAPAASPKNDLRKDRSLALTTMLRQRLTVFDILNDDI